MVEQRFDLGMVILEIRRIHFGGDAEWKARPLGNLNGVIRPFLRRNSSQECQISLGL